jgi:hypothetical protein
LKPKPYASVHEMLLQGDRPQGSILPYDTYTSEKASYLTFAVRREFIALPLLSLNKASLRGDADSLALEFGTTIVQITGRNLDDLFEDILLGKVRIIREGKHLSCTVDTIRFREAVRI